MTWIVTLKDGSMVEVDKATLIGGYLIPEILPSIPAALIASISPKTLTNA